MTIRINQLTFSDQIKFGMLSKEDQARVLNCKSINEAKALLNNMRESVRLDIGSYEPKLQVSGSAVKYKTKNLFTEIFDEQDVKDFIALVEMSAELEDEVAAGELKRKISDMQRQGRQPLQCLVYATKQNEKSFYNNEKKVSLWAQVIAETVNANPEYAVSINHMLVNWGMWKCQIRMLITACGYMRRIEKLDEVIRDLYTDYDDDKVRFTVIKRLLHGFDQENYKSAFLMLRKADFIGTESDRKYFNALKRKVENAGQEEKEALYIAFRGTQGISGARRRRIEALFVDEPESGSIAKEINESSAEQKDAVLRMVHNKIYGAQRDYREVAGQARQIIQYRTEIQQMFMDKLSKTHVGLEDIKIYSLAIGDLDESGRAVPFLEEQMSLYFDEEKKVMFSYVLAVLSDEYIDLFIDTVLKYDGNSVSSLLNSVRNLGRQGKNQIIRQYLYSNCLNIKELKGIDSREFKTALRNIGVFLQGRNTYAVYDVKFDQMLFEFLGYNKAEGVVDEVKCTTRKAALVLGILENVMDQNNYEGRYMKFMWDLFAYFRDRNVEITKRIDETVKHLTGQGIPTALLE